MKKILIAALALITVLTMSLTACGDTQNPEDENPNDDLISRDDEEPTDNEDEDNTDDKTDDQTPDDSGDGPTQTPVGGWTSAAATVYAKTASNVRENASKTSTSLGVVQMGTALTRVETNGTWDKITYNGNTAYILSDLVTVSQNRVTFEDKTADDMTLHLTASNKTNLRSSPVVSDHVDNLKGTIRAEDTANGTLKLAKLSADKAWAEVRFTGTDENGKTFVGTEVLYISTTYIQELASGNNNEDIAG